MFIQYSCCLFISNYTSDLSFYNSRVKRNQFIVLKVYLNICNLYIELQKLKATTALINHRHDALRRATRNAPYFISVLLSAYATPRQVPFSSSISHISSLTTNKSEKYIARRVIIMYR